MKDKKRNLTQAMIDKLVCEGGSYSIFWDAKQGGLGVKVEPTGYKSYVYQALVDGRSRRKMIAACNKINLTQAREIANKYAVQVSAYHAGEKENPFDTPDSIPLYNFCIEYLETRKPGATKKALSQGTYNDWMWAINKHIKPNSEDKQTKKTKPNPWGNKDIKKFSIGDATKVMESLASVPVQGNRLRSVLSLVFDYAIKKNHREIGTNVWEYVDKHEENPQRPRLDEDKNHPGLFLDYMQKAESGEVKDKQNRLIDPSWVYMIWVYYFTGARPSEIASLKISEIDFDNAVIRKEKTKTGKKEILLSDEAIYFLRLAIEKIERVKGNDYVFAGKKGKSYRKAWGAKQWTNLREATSITAPPYALRRYFTTIGVRIQVEDNGDKKIVTDIMGHANVEMTDLYAGKDKNIEDGKRKILKSESDKIAERLKRTLTNENS